MIGLGILLVAAFVLYSLVDDGFNGSTLTFGGSVSKLRSIGWSASSNEADVTSTSDSNHEYTPGVQDIELSVEVVGISTVDVGDTGTTVVTWNSSTSDTEGGTSFTMLCTGRDSSGSLDGELTTSLTFKPYGG